MPGKVRIRFTESTSSRQVADVSRELNSVCQSAHCPNKTECWSLGTATFMVLGDSCTRACRFCAIRHSSAPPLPDSEEPARLADAVQGLGMRYVVITSVTRDDLPDGGSAHIASCVRMLRGRIPGLIIETLVPDFKTDPRAITNVISSKPDVVSHNIETVERL